MSLAFLLSALVVSEDLPPRSARQIVASEVLVNLLNPKLTIFFAFLPQFVPAGAGQPVARMLALSARVHGDDVRGVRALRSVRRLGPHAAAEPTPNREPAAPSTDDGQCWWDPERTSRTISVRSSPLGSA